MQTFKEQLRIERLEEIQRLIEQHTFALEQLINEKDFLTPQVEIIKEERRQADEDKESGDSEPEKEG